MARPRGIIDTRNPVEWRHPLSRGLVSWWLPFGPWRGGDTLRDLARRNNGTLTNGPTWTAGRDGFGALQFDGSNDYIDPNVKLAGLGLSSAGTVSVYVRPASLVTRSPCGENVGAGTDYDVGTIFSISDGTWWTRWANSTGTQATVNAGTYTVGRWDLVTSVYDGGNVRLYVNGTSVGAAALTGTVRTTGATGWKLGRRGDYTTVNYYWTGLIGSGRIHNRALSASEVASLYDQTLRGYPDLLRRYSTARWFVGSGGGVSDTIAADSGTYTLTGTAATVATSRRVVAASGSFTLTGSDATIRVRRRVTAGAGSFTLTGTDAAVGVSRRLTSDAGTYTLAGTAADLPVGRRLTAASGSYTLTGTDANIVASTDGGTTLAADSGAYTLTGGAATLRVTRRLTAASGAVSLAGADAGVSVTRRLTAASGSYTVAGTAADLPTGRRIAAGSGSFSLAGAAADIRASTDTAGDTTLYVFNLF